MSKTRKHKWVTSALKNKEYKLSVWMSEEDKKDSEKIKKFAELLSRINNDPRVMGVDKRPHPIYGDIFVFSLDNNAKD